VLDERSLKILNFLKQSERFVSIDELMQSCHISKRTVYYDMDKINDWLKSNRLGPVMYLRSLGYMLPDETRQKVPSLLQTIGVSQYYYTHKERKVWLAVHLISSSNPIFLQDMVALHQVSRGTVHKEISVLKDELESYRLSIVFDRVEGYLVEGAEFSKRKALVHYLAQVMPRNNWDRGTNRIPALAASRLLLSELPLLQKEQLQSVIALIAQYELATEIELTDDMVYFLALQLLLSGSRIKEGKWISLDSKILDELKRMPEYVASAGLSMHLSEMFAVDYPDEEIGFTAMCLLGARVNRMNRILAASEDMDKLVTIVATMVDRFQNNACVYFHNRDELEKHLLAHLKPAYFRVKFDLEMNDSAADAVKEKYKELISITRYSIKPMEEFTGKAWSDTQLAYIAMHFGGWLRRESMLPSVRRKAVIVCVNGISTSQLLKSEIEHLFPSLEIDGILSLRDYERYNHDADYVFTTVPLLKKGKNTKVFVVNPILTDLDKEKLAQQVHVLTNVSTNQTGFVGTLMDRIKQYAQVYNESGLLDELNVILRTDRQFKLHKADRPSLMELLKDDTIRMAEDIDENDWRAAIRLVAEPLILSEAIQPSYVEAMIRAIEIHGPYMIVSPGIAIAHAKPDDGANRLSMSLLHTLKGVQFSPDSDHRVYLLFVLACVDKEAHLKAVYQLTALMNEEERRKGLIQAGTKDRLLHILQTFTEREIS
jgi:mannitol operon transcriptional antiterminator